MVVAEPPKYLEWFPEQLGVPEAICHPPVPHQRKMTEAEGEAGARPTLRPVLQNLLEKNSGTWLGAEGTDLPETR